MTAWLLAAYSLPFVIFMAAVRETGRQSGQGATFPERNHILFRRLRDLSAGGKLAATPDRPHSARGWARPATTPLCIAIIAERFPAEQRGRAMGTWSSVAPGAGDIGARYWADMRSISSAGTTSSYRACWLRSSPCGRRTCACRRSAPFAGEGLQAFDWLGRGPCWGARFVFAIFYLSSRTVTGVEPLRDWRLLAAAAGFGLLFWRREGRTARPLVNFALYRRKNFGVASLAAGFRMVIMHTANFLNVLFLTDVYGLDAIGLGIFTTIFSGAIFATTQVGGQLSDRIHGRWIVGRELRDHDLYAGRPGAVPSAAAGRGGVDADAVAGGRAGDGCASPCGDGDPHGRERGGRIIQHGADSAAVSSARRSRVWGCSRHS